MSKIEYARTYIDYEVRDKKYLDALTAWGLCRWELIFRDAETKQHVFKRVIGDEYIFPGDTGWVVLEGHGVSHYFEKLSDESMPDSLCGMYTTPNSCIDKGAPEGLNRCYVCSDLLKEKEVYSNA